jgi:3-methyladenine DNA glycosylase AlkD
MTLTARAAEARLKSLGEPDRVAGVQRFFKTGPGEYGAGDRFLGVRVPAIRRLTRELRGFPLDQMLKLLESPWHEARLLALLLMVDAYTRGDEAQRQATFDAYLDSTARIDKWDLVDASAGQIVGAHLLRRNRSLLTRLAKSENVWERRIAIIATFPFIRAEDHADTLRIAKLLLADRHDLIHKAVGWMLREVGKRDRAALEGFLHRHSDAMPRTMLRYAIERFDAEERARWMRRS